MNLNKYSYSYYNIINKIYIFKQSETNVGANRQDTQIELVVELVPEELLANKPQVQERTANEQSPLDVRSSAQNTPQQLDIFVE